MNIKIQLNCMGFFNFPRVICNLNFVNLNIKIKIGYMQYIPSMLQIRNFFSYSHQYCIFLLNKFVIWTKISSFVSNFVLVICYKLYCWSYFEISSHCTLHNIGFMVVYRRPSLVGDQYVNFGLWNRNWWKHPILWKWKIFK